MSDLVEGLYPVAKNGDTDALLKALSQVPKESEACFGILGMLNKVGDQAKVVPVYLARMKAEKMQDGRLWSDTTLMLSGLGHWNDPRAVNFLIEQLQNPKTNAGVRQFAYNHAAASEDPRAISAVLALRDNSDKIDPIEKRMGLDKLGLKVTPYPEYRDGVLAIHKMPDGRTFGLIKNWVLGSREDLFIAEWKGGKWVHPLFTGQKWTIDKAYKPAEIKAQAARQKKLMAGEWVTDFIDNPAILKDSDGDGLNDLAEERLGTDPKKADTDGDGIPDSIDRCPFTKRAPVTDEEQIVAAAIEARFRFTEKPWTPVALSYPTGTDFVCTGTAGWIVPETASKLRSTFGQGTAFVRVMISPIKGQKHVYVEIDVTYEGLDGTGYQMEVKKLRGQWVVISSFMRWIS